MIYFNIQRPEEYSIKAVVTELAEDKQKEEVVDKVKDEILFPRKWKNCFIFSFSGRLRSGRGGVDKVRRERRR